MASADNTGHGRRVLCDRCGVPRVARYGARTQLCRDCHSSLTPVEREAWVIPVKEKTQTIVDYKPTPVRSLTELGAMNLGVRIGGRRTA